MGALRALPGGMIGALIGMSFGFEDVRVAEIELLTYLEDHQSEGFTLGRDDAVVIHGLPTSHFKSMLFELLEQGCLDQPGDLRVASVSMSDRMAIARQDLQKYIYEHRAVGVCLNHRGRLRLARLREEMSASRIRDKFGILIDQRHWKRDLRIHMMSVKKDRPLTLVFSDLDSFKPVNDKLGHDFGDDCLRYYFKIALDVFEAVGDVYCRGGDEVLAILPNTSVKRAREIADSFREEIERGFAAYVKITEAGLTPLTVSVGVAQFSKPTDPALASSIVDQAQYDSKKAGKNRVSVAMQKVP